MHLRSVRPVSSRRDENFDGDSPAILLVSVMIAASASAKACSDEESSPLDMNACVYSCPYRLMVRVVMAVFVAERTGN